MDLRLINIPRDLHMKVKIEAIKNGMTLNNFTIQLLRGALKSLQEVEKTK